ncbi:MAG: hypothetical protein L3J96_02290, partial [Thermoplasmata archaeon]|nr:hypothetical protein [Thermoplasmata archaeon]
MPDDQVDAFVGGPCPSCAAEQLTKLEDMDYVEFLYSRADAGGATVRLVSAESEEGEMLVKAFAGVAAILRYPMGERLRSPAPN